jgi:uncharacterized protein (DUF2141 family)
MVRHAGAPEASLKPILPGLGLVLALGACASPNRPPEPVEGSHSLAIEIRHIDCCQGVMRVALYNHANHWLNEQGMVRGQALPLLGTEQTVEFAGLPAGDYAVALYQDINGNARLDRFLGMIPREPYGFSGNQGGIGKPSFRASKVSVPAVSEITIDMRPPPFGAIKQ